jgi:GAF domain-containing protein
MLTQGELDRIQLLALIEASKLLNSTLDRDEVLQHLLTLAAQGLDADRAVLQPLDKGWQEIKGTDLAGHVVRTGETVNLANAGADPRFVQELEGVRTVLAMPLYDPPEQISGVVQVFDKRQGPFSEDDEGYLLALLEHAALALRNARHYAALKDDHERILFLLQVSKLTTDQDSGDKVRLRDVLLTVMDGVTKALKADASSILLWDRRRKRLVFVATIGEKERELTEIQVPLEGSIAGWVILNEESVIINDVQSDPRFFSGADESTGFVTRNLICSPMEVRGKIVGVLEVLNKSGGASFTEADLQLLQAVADHTASAIKNARRYEDLLRVGEHHRRRATAGLFNPLSPLGR